MDAIKESMTSLKELFHSGLAELQKELEKSGHGPTNTTSLASDFNAFKKFMVTALESLQKQVDFLALELDRQEMRSRRKMLLLHGIPESVEEPTPSVVSMVTNKLNISDFTSASISRCHRLGQPSENKHRPLVVKFRDVSVRDEIWFSKAKLKGTGTTLSEFLIRSRHAVFLEARQRFGEKNCWTRAGVIRVLAPDGSRHHVESMAELDAITGESEPSSPAPSPAPSEDTPPATVNKPSSRRPVARNKRAAKK